MSEHVSSALISRRTLLRGGAVAAAGVPAYVLPPSGPLATQADGRPRRTGIANVRVSHDHYGVHVEPSVAANPRNRHHLLAACQASPTANPEFIATYLSFDGGATWHNGGLPRLPAGHRKKGDDVTVAFDAHGRGYVCATRLAHAAGSDVYIWRTDDGGRSFSAPVSLRAGQYHDHPGVATGQDQAPSEHNVYVVWAAGSGTTALGFTRSTDGGQSFEPPRTILAESTIPSMDSAGPELAAGPHGLVCATCYWTTQQHASGDRVGQAVAVCSTDGGRSFAAPVHLGSGSSIIALPGGVLPNSSPTVAATPNGYLYVAFPKHQPGAKHSNIVVVESSDRGRTWPKAVTATPDDGVTYFQPNLAVDPRRPRRGLRIRPRQRPRAPSPTRLPASGAPLPATAASDHHRVRPTQPHGPAASTEPGGSATTRASPPGQPESSTSCGTTPAPESSSSSRPRWRPNRTIALRQTRRRMWWSSISPTSRRHRERVRDR